MIRRDLAAFDIDFGRRRDSDGRRQGSRAKNEIAVCWVVIDVLEFALGISVREFRELVAVQEPKAAFLESTKASF